MQPGLYNLTRDNYHADPCPTPSLSSSIAQIILEQSPLHALLAHPRLNANFQPEESSKFDLGSAAHLMLLERREDAIVRVQADDWRTKAAKDARVAAQANGQFAVLERQFGDIVKMCNAAQDFLVTTELGDILATGDAEQSALWQEGEYWYRARPDLLSTDRKIILDYKSTSSAAPDFIAKQIGRMGYDMQAEFYSRGVEKLTGIAPTFVFLFQEVTAPYACSLISLSNTYREVGKLKVQRAMALWEKSLSTGSWGAYSSKILYCEPKPWDAAQLEDTTSEEET